jgi:hypothetical protein
MVEGTGSWRNLSVLGHLDFAHTGLDVQDGLPEEKAFLPAREKRKKLEAAVFDSSLRVYMTAVGDTLQMNTARARLALPGRRALAGVSEKWDLESELGY